MVWLCLFVFLPLLLVLDSILILHMSGVFFLDYVRSLSTCLFNYVFLFIFILNLLLFLGHTMWHVES